MVIETNNETLTDIIENNSLVLVDFWGRTCTPCKIFLPMYEGISEEVEGAVFTKVCVDDEPALTEQYGILGVPTLVAIRDGEVVATGTGIPKIMPILDRVKNGAI